MGQFRAAQEHLRSECGWLFVQRYAADTSKLAEQIEQQQYAPEDGIGGVEIPETESVRPQIVFELGDPVLHVRAVIVVPPDLFRWPRHTRYQHPKSVLGQIDQLLSHRCFGIAN